MLSRLLLPLLFLSLALPAFTPATAHAEDEDKDEEVPYDEMTPEQVRIQSVRLRKRIAALDRNDTAAAYALSLRREARQFIGGGLGVVGVTLGASIVTLAVSPNDKYAPLVASIGVPIGLGVVVAGLPAMILAPRFLGWYANNGPAPSHLARLKLLNRWSMEEMRIRRDTSLVSTAFFGAATILTVAVWAGRDRNGANGVVGTNYDAGDAVTALTFLAVTSSTGISAVVWSLQYRDALMNKHRLFVMPTMSAGPEVLPRSVAQRLEGVRATTGMAVRGALTLHF